MRSFFLLVCVHSAIPAVCLCGLLLVDSGSMTNALSLFKYRLTKQALSLEEWHSLYVVRLQPSFVRFLVRQPSFVALFLANGQPEILNNKAGRLRLVQNSPSGREKRQGGIHLLHRPQPMTFAIFPVLASFPLLSLLTLPSITS